MLEVNLGSIDNVRILYDNKSIQTPCKIAPAVGEHTLEIFGDLSNVKQIKVFDQTLDRKKALQLEKSLLFIFDIVRRHSKAMLRKDRITIYD